MKRFKPLERICKNCGSSYMANREWQRYCSPACRVAHWRNEHPTVTPELIADTTEAKKRIESLEQRVKELEGR